MAACSKYRHRFKTALEFRKLPFPTEIYDYLAKRATTDRSLDRIICAVLDIIEPPNCPKSHCPHHTAFSFCGCSQNLVPGRCPLNLEYLRNKKKREEKIINQRINQIPGKYLPLDEETKKKIIAMSNDEWKKTVRKFPKELTGITT